MRKFLVIGVGACLMWAACMAASLPHSLEAGVKEETQIAHMVYFTLKDNSPTAKAALVSACNKYLTKHTGEVFYRAGTRATEFKQGVNDLDFDVSLHIIFQDPAAYQRYEVAPRHKQFIEENKGNWKKVRVFDSVVVATK
jgi:hypothetical protein